MTNRTEGSKYDSNLSTTEIAKRVRADIKAAIAAGELPKGIKVGVRSAYFSGGSSITVSIKAWPGDVLNPASVYASALNVFEERSRLLYCKGVRSAMRTLDAMLDEYNYNASDSQVDHFDVNFYSHVDVRVPGTVAERNALLESAALNDLRVSKAAGENLVHYLDAYDTSGGDEISRRY